MPKPTVATPTFRKLKSMLGMKRRERPVWSIYMLLGLQSCSASGGEQLLIGKSKHPFYLDADRIKAAKNNSFQCRFVDMEDKESLLLDSWCLLGFRSNYNMKCILILPFDSPN